MEYWLVMGMDWTLGDGGMAQGYWVVRIGVTAGFRTTLIHYKRICSRYRGWKELMK